MMWYDLSLWCVIGDRIATFLQAKLDRVATLLKNYRTGLLCFDTNIGSVATFWHNYWIELTRSDKLTV